MPRITLRDHKVHYQQTGSGPDVVLIHGLSCNIAFWWFNIAQRLAAHYRVTAVDLRGHGFSGMTESGYRAVDLATDLAALLDHLGIGYAHLVAHSFGGAVAAALATERPDLVSELTLADAWLPSLQAVPPLPAAGEWAATRARALTAGIEVDSHLPLVVRALYSELLDESEYQAETSAARVTASDNFGWEDPSPSPSGFSEGGAASPRPRGGFWQKPLGAGRPLWPGRGGRWFGRGIQQTPPGALNEPRVSPAQPGRPETLPDLAVQGAAILAGAPGKPSQGVRRWQELMARTHARLEFLDTTAIEARRLSDIKAPVRLVYGSRSQYRETAEALETLLPQSRLQIVPRAAHYFPLLRPQALMDAMEESIAAARRSGKSTVPPGRSAPNLRLVIGRDDPAPERLAVRSAVSPEEPEAVRQPPASGAPRA